MVTTKGVNERFAGVPEKISNDFYAGTSRGPDDEDRLRFIYFKCGMLYSTSQLSNIIYSGYI